MDKELKKLRELSDSINELMPLSSQLDPKDLAKLLDLLKRFAEIN